MLVSCCVRSGMIFSHYNRGCATVRSERRKRKERERWQQRGQRVGGRTEEGRTRGLACAACLLFVLSSLLGEDVNLDRAAEGESPRRRFPPFEEAWLRLWQLKVVTSIGGT